MELLNESNRFKAETDADRTVLREALESATLMLAPVTPHLCHEIWKSLNDNADLAIVDARWPQTDDAALVRDSLELVVQVNGKLRSKITVPSGTGKDECEAMALADENVQRHTEGKTVRKVIVVPEKLVNIVVS